MKTKSAKAKRPWMKKPARVPEKEWNFDNVPDDEAPFCLYYEYGRSAENFKAQVAAWRQRNPKVCDAARKLVSLIKRKEEHTAASVKEFGEAWNSFLKMSWFGSQDAMYPDGLSHTDHRTTMCYFPSFPDAPWQAIDEPIRKAAFFLLNPNTHLEAIQLPGTGAVQSPHPAATLAAQREIQKLVNRPMSEQQLAQSARWQMNEHVFSPPLIEAANFGIVPASVRLDKNGNQAWAEGFCRERVSFILNWACGNDEIEMAFKNWLKTPGRRAHKKFEHWKTTNPREHLRKLGAYRILKSGVTAEQACDHDVKTGNHYTLYTSPDEYRRAKRQAEALLKEIFPPADT